MFKFLGSATAVALATSLFPATAVSQGPVYCSGDPNQKFRDEAVATTLLANCKLTVYALGDDGKVWWYRRTSADRGLLPEETKWKTGWNVYDGFGEGVASAPSIARDGTSAVSLVDGTVRVGGESIGGSAKHVEAAGNASRTFYARPFILNWWPNHDPHLGSADAVPTHTAVFLWWSDGYVYYRTRNNGGKKAWSNWIKLPQARVYSDPAVVARLRQPYLDVFAQGANNTLVHWTWNGDVWQFETVPMAKPASAPTAIIRVPSSLYGINTAAVSAGKHSCGGKYARGFHDVLTNMCWSCPADFKRTVWQPIGHYANGKWTGIANGCEQGGVVGFGAKISHATHHGPRGCPAGSFRNGLTDDCYRCPGRGQRTIVPGNDLTKMSDACRQTVWGIFSVTYLGVSGKIEGMGWDLGAANNRFLSGREVKAGWYVDNDELPKEFASASSAPVIVVMEGMYLFARDASGEFLSYSYGSSETPSLTRLGAPRKPERGIPAIIEIAVHVERLR